MRPATPASPAALHAAIDAEGFAFVEGPAMREMLQTAGTLGDWDTFTASWDHLELDRYMADGGRYRRRRHATFAVDAEGRAVRQAHQPHYQSLDYNPLHGGVERWFEPIEDHIGSGASLATIIDFCRTTFGSLAPDIRTWHVEVHQFRIEATRDQTGRPTPEGLHRDGVDYVLVLLIRRENIARGVTTIHGGNGAMLGQFTLTMPFDAAIVNDRQVAHGVTPVEPIDPLRPAFRDVLVVTFRSAPPAR